MELKSYVEHVYLSQMRISNFSVYLVIGVTEHSSSNTNYNITMNKIERLLFVTCKVSFNEIAECRF